VLSLRGGKLGFKALLVSTGITVFIFVLNILLCICSWRWLHRFKWCQTSHSPSHHIDIAAQVQFWCCCCGCWYDLFGIYCMSCPFSVWMGDCLWQLNHKWFIS